MKKILSLMLIIYILFANGYTANGKERTVIKLNTNKLVLTVKEVYDLCLTYTKGIKRAEWVSKNNKVATVNSSTGEVTARKKGKTYIICTFKKNKKMYQYKCAVTVKNFPKFVNYKLMAHALGAVDNTYIYSNSLEGLEQSTKNRFKYMETDIILTSDNKLVCSHGWTKFTYDYTGVPYNAENPVMTYDEFMNTKIQGKYTTIDLSTIVEYMKKHKDVYFMFDLRTIDKATAIETTQKIIEAFKDNEKLFDRIVMQAGSQEMYEGIDSVYHFKYYQYFIHDSEIDSIDNIINWCKKNNIVVASIYEDAITEDIIRKLKENG
ncbi:Ig-like domain-containing protein [Clostridium oryzae]|uniref:Bacterial Ig-like domain protein n=1 Tax=Clostridium oryzae TaxID=1450648 RepID=A0A1V4IDL1_9CLOT|nr:Ig-like domain-containing protein [Clostridium oryzae]OPJ58051.1 bacterial Ig-like domain protein [Clostridium oryzae]